MVSPPISGPTFPGAAASAVDVVDPGDAAVAAAVRPGVLSVGPPRAQEAGEGLGVTLEVVVGSQPSHLPTGRSC